MRSIIRRLSRRHGAPLDYGTGWGANVHDRGLTGSFGAYAWAICAHVN